MCYASPFLSPTLRKSDDFLVWDMALLSLALVPSRNQSSWVYFAPDLTLTTLNDYYFARHLARGKTWHTIFPPQRGRDIFSVNCLVPVLFMTFSPCVVLLLLSLVPVIPRGFIYSRYFHNSNVLNYPHSVLGVAYPFRF